MSNLREKARAVKAAGEAERGNFEPTGAPKRLYNYWLGHTNSTRGKKIRRGDQKENFCHFWRVVAVWAPLMFVKNFLMDHHTKFIGAVLIAAAAVFAIALFTVPNMWFVILQGIVGALIFAVLVVGFIGGVSLSLTPDERVDYDLPDKKPATIMSLIGIPSAIVGFAGGKAFKGLAKVLVPFTQNHPKAAAITYTALGLAAIGTFVFFAGGLFALSVYGLIVAGIAALIALIIFASAVGSDYISGQRELKRKFNQDYYDAHGEFPPVKKAKEPNAFEKKVSAFFRGLGDFIVLIGQVVRVNKWKICPTLEIKT